MLTVDLQTRTLTSASRDGGLAVYLGVAGALHLGLALLATELQASPPSPPPAIEVSLVMMPPPSRAPEPEPVVERAEPVPASSAPELPESVEPASPAPAPDLASAAAPAPTPESSPEPMTAPPMAPAPQPAARRDVAVSPSHPAAKPKRPERVAIRPAAPPNPVQPQPATHAAEAQAAPPQPVERTVVTPATIAAAEASFEGRLLAAVQEAARRDYPAAARMMGMTGQAAVSFQYRDGSVRVVGLMQSSGSPVLDRAALAAVQSAHYPPAPPALSGQTLTKLVHVRFDLSSS